jgi:murein DD-endopeptidase MepM/ murein hydrolase activator NlpD
VRFLRPIAGPWTDAFGWYTGRRHTGLDFPAAMGAPVAAAGVGTVASAGFNTGGYGNLVVIRHRLGFESWYAHLSTITVAVGAPVTGGTQIGLVGSTGNSTGPHLHFEVRRFGTPIDPVPYLLGAVARARPERPASRPLTCRPNADARRTRDTDPPAARLDRCP